LSTIYCCFEMQSLMKRWPELVVQTLAAVNVRGWSFPAGGSPFAGGSPSAGRNPFAGGSTVAGVRGSVAEMRGGEGKEMCCHVGVPTIILILLS
jgi:hypothetical protein